MLYALLALTCPLPVAHAADIELGQPEASPFDEKADAKGAVDSALARAKAGNRLVLIVMGANWCHDSRALAGWFAQSHFAAMIVSRYELVFVDVGYRDRNIGIARRFGLKSVKGTPTVLIVSHNEKLLNKEDASKWRNAASRSAQSIYKSFAEFTPA